MRRVNTQAWLAAASVVAMVAPAWAQRREVYDWNALAPEVVDLIGPTYLAHAAEFPDAEEPAAVLRAYLEQDELTRAGRHDEAVSFAREIARSFPAFRHAQAGLGRALWERYQPMRRHDDLVQSMGAYARAHGIGLRNGRVRYTDVLALGLARLGDPASLRAVFEPVLALFPDDALLMQQYASALARLDAPDAEPWLKKALALRPPEGAIEPVLDYGRYLIGRDRFREALQVLQQPPEEEFPVVSFYCGAAAERSGQLGLAGAEYRRAAAFTHSFPVPEEYRTALASQSGIRFQGDLSAAHDCTGKHELARVIQCESGGESAGGQRAVGWTVRNRVFHSNSGGCTFANSGSTTCAKYNTVVNAPNQFCETTATSTSETRAEQVFHASRADPYPPGGWCPAGSVSGSDKCTASCTQEALTQGNHASGEKAFYSTTGACAANHPWIPAGCTSGPAKTCGNGGSDHCFYRVP